MIIINFGLNEEDEYLKECKTFNKRNMKKISKYNRFGR
jgi:hypothetical protein